MSRIFHRLNFTRYPFALATPLLKNVSGLTLPRLNYKLFNLANQKSLPYLFFPLWVFIQTLLQPDGLTPSVTNTPVLLYLVPLFLSPSPHPFNSSSHSFQILPTIQGSAYVPSLPEAPMTPNFREDFFLWTPESSLPHSVLKEALDEATLNFSGEYLLCLPNHSVDELNLFVIPSPSTSVKVMQLSLCVMTLLNHQWVLFFPPPTRPPPQLLQVRPVRISQPPEPIPSFQVPVSILSWALLSQALFMPFQPDSGPRSLPTPFILCVSQIHIVLSFQHTIFHAKVFNIILLHS